MPLENNSPSALEHAQHLFREYYASCFWHLKPDLIVTDAMLPLIVKGLRTHGGRRGMLAAGELVAMQGKDSSCR